MLSLILEILVAQAGIGWLPGSKGFLSSHWLNPLSMDTPNTLSLDVGCNRICHLLKLLFHLTLIIWKGRNEMGPLLLTQTIISIVRSVTSTLNPNFWRKLIGTIAPAHSPVFSKQLRLTNADGSNKFNWQDKLHQFYSRCEGTPVPPPRRAANDKSPFLNSFTHNQRVIPIILQLHCQLLPHNA